MGSKDISRMSVGVGSTSIGVSGTSTGVGSASIHKAQETSLEATSMSVAAACSMPANLNTMLQSSPEQHTLLEDMRDKLHSQLGEIRVHVAETCRVEVERQMWVRTSQNAGNGLGASKSALPNRNMLDTLIFDYLSEVKEQMAEICRVELAHYIWTVQAEVGDDARTSPDK